MAMMKRLMCCCVGKTDVTGVNILPKRKALEKAVKAEQAKSKDASHQTTKEAQQDRSGKAKDDVYGGDTPPDVVPTHDPNTASSPDPSETTENTKAVDVGDVKENEEPKSVKVEIKWQQPISKSLAPVVEEDITSTSNVKYSVEEKTASFLTLNLAPTTLDMPPTMPNPSGDQQPSSEQFDVSNKKRRKGSGRSLYVLKKTSPDTEIQADVKSPTSDASSSANNVNKVLLLQSKAPDGNSSCTDSESELEKQN